MTRKIGGRRWYRSSRVVYAKPFAPDSVYAYTSRSPTEFGGTLSPSHQPNRMKRITFIRLGSREHLLFRFVRRTLCANTARLIIRANYFTDSAPLCCRLSLCKATTPTAKPNTAPHRSPPGKQSTHNSACTLIKRNCTSPALLFAFVSTGGRLCLPFVSAATISTVHHCRRPQKVPETYEMDQHRNI